MSVARLLDSLSAALWGWHVLLLILAAGAWFSYESCFYQLLHIGRWLRAALGSSGRKGEQGGATRFQALTAALAGSIGTGNIVGVAAALTVGGPGALFWMGASATLGMMTVFAENYFAARCREAGRPAGQHNRSRQGGRRPAGPLHYIERAGRFGGALAAVYALGCCLSSLGMGNMAQMNAFAAACQGLGLPALPVALGAGVLVFFVARGGLGFAVKITEKLVPAMTLLFFAASLGTLWVHRANLPAAVGSVFQGAFSLRAGAGGTAGMLIAMKAGVSRGVFTNEAGLGSSAFAYEEVRGHSPEELGCLGIFQVFADTLVMCTVTGLCILCSCPPQGLEGAELTFYAYRSALGDRGGWAVSLCTALFALATVVAWCCYGREGLLYLTGGRGKTLYGPLAAAAAMIGCAAPVGAVLQVGDAFNGLMALPNVAALFWLAAQAANRRKAESGGKKVLEDS